MSPGIRRAAIDVGTNSVKLLVAETWDRAVEPIIEESEQTRLGAGLYASHLLQPSAIAETARAVADFSRRAHELGAISIRVVATSAAREADNANDLLAAIEQASGLKAAIISGEQEAEWAFQGVLTDARLAQQSLLLMDVGGGSTEFILGLGEKREFWQSFPLGTVRLLEKLRPGDPPAAGEHADCREWVRDFLRKEVRPRLEPALTHLRAEAGSSPVQLMGTGGTATIMARMEASLDTYDRDAIEAVKLTSHAVQSWNERLWRLPLAERRMTTGLPQKRADVILTGLAIYEAVMETLGFSEMRVTTRGLRFAIVLQA